MPATVTVRDETCDGRPAHEWCLEVDELRMTLRDLIGERIRREVEEYNARRPHRYRGLVQPPAEARRPDSDSSDGPTFKPLDWSRQTAIACEAFQSGQVLVFVGDVQASQLDEELEIAPTTAVTFVRLALLVGG